ncbi:NAD-dependent succinate-semialdehyde dehydrogenase [Anianabacter salinae]|uniref:NAD-dependent succinate-semialdehyde dehydrogenase n=1 Tax=Anianabacter salinae TaxID=2851023 RepID=UPI00225E1523|nr:NAD-dependent succinate-semialdehyde dehydrogenase [Anianabacter salinae]
MADRLHTINPATGEPINSYDLMSDTEVNRTIEAAHAAFGTWGATPAADRANAIRSVGAVLRERKDALARLMSQEMGKLLSQSEQEIDLCAAICDWTAETGPNALADEERDLMNGGKGVIGYAPIGVIYGIQPWNFPAYQVFRYAIANLMSGNTVLLKHAESVTGSALFLQEVFDASDLPKDAFKVLRITHEQSDNVIAHDLVRGVTLTGSERAGKHVGAEAGKHLKKSVLELGSNDAYLVLEDADIETAVKQSVMGRVYNNGETCVAAKRFIVVDAVYDQFKEAFVAAMNDLKAGDPMEGEADIGPMAREDLRDTLHHQVRASVDKGATILCGGEIPDGQGFYYPATVLGDVAPGMPAYDDELFGPVASLIRATDAKDAMRIANDSRFGLGGGIFSRDEDAAVKLAMEHFDTGMVFVNGFGLAQPDMPFGGVKHSGHGREHGGFGMKEFVNVKAVNILAA